MHARGNQYSADGCGAGDSLRDRIRLAASRPSRSRATQSEHLGRPCRGGGNLLPAERQGTAEGAAASGQETGHAGGPARAEPGANPRPDGTIPVGAAVFSAILLSRKFHDVDTLLAPRLASDVLLMTDGLSAYRKISVQWPGCAASGASPVALWQIISAGTGCWMPPVKHSLPKNFLPPAGAERQTQRAPPTALRGTKGTGGEIGHVQAVHTVVESCVLLTPTCPKCGRNEIARWGSASGLPRYRCAACQAMR
jgi:hypothetical protein